MTRPPNRPRSSVMDGWMDGCMHAWMDDFRCYVFFGVFSAASRVRKIGDSGRLCVPSSRLKELLPSVGIEPGTAMSASKRLPSGLRGPLSCMKEFHM